MSHRSFDLIVFGATGKVGRNISRYIHKNGSFKRWAILGRSHAKLSALASELREMNLSHNSIPDILLADALDFRALRDIFVETRMVLNCVVPYRSLGKDIIEACLMARCDYVDLCSEPLFIESSYLDFQEEAKKKSVFILHGCGVDAALHMLGTMYLLQQFAPDECNCIDAYFSVPSLDGGAAESMALQVDAEDVSSFVYNRAERDSLEATTIAISKKFKTPIITHPGKRLEKKTGHFFERRIGQYAVQSCNSDTALVKHSLRSISIADNTLDTWPQFFSYLTVQDYYGATSAAFQTSLRKSLSSFSLGRSILLAFPAVFASPQKTTARGSSTSSSEVVSNPGEGRLIDVNGAAPSPNPTAGDINNYNNSNNDSGGAVVTATDITVKTEEDEMFIDETGMDKVPDGAASTLMSGEDAPVFSLQMIGKGYAALDAEYLAYLRQQQREAEEMEAAGWNTYMDGASGGESCDYINREDLRNTTFGFTSCQNLIWGNQLAGESFRDDTSDRNPVELKTCVQASRKTFESMENVNTVLVMTFVQYLKDIRQSERAAFAKCSSSSSSSRSTPIMSTTVVTPPGKGDNGPSETTTSSAAAAIVTTDYQHETPVARFVSPFAVKKRSSSAAPVSAATTSTPSYLQALAMTPMTTGGVFTPLSAFYKSAEDILGRMQAVGISFNVVSGSSRSTWKRHQKIREKQNLSTGGGGGGGVVFTERAAVGTTHVSIAYAQPLVPEQKETRYKNSTSTVKSSNSKSNSNNIGAPTFRTPERDGASSAAVVATLSPVLTSSTHGYDKLDMVDDDKEEEEEEQQQQDQQQLEQQGQREEEEQENVCYDCGTGKAQTNSPATQSGTTNSQQHSASSSAVGTMVGGMVAAAVIGSIIAVANTRTTSCSTPPPPPPPSEEADPLCSSSSSSSFIAETTTCNTPTATANSADSYPGLLTRTISGSNVSDTVCDNEV